MVALTRSSAYDHTDEYLQNVDMEKLASGLEALGADDLLHIVQLIHENRTDDTYTKNDVESMLCISSLITDTRLTTHSHRRRISCRPHDTSRRAHQESLGLHSQQSRRYDSVIRHDSSRVLDCDSERPPSEADPLDPTRMVVDNLSWVGDMIAPYMATLLSLMVCFFFFLHIQRAAIKRGMLLAYSMQTESGRTIDQNMTFHKY